MKTKDKVFILSMFAAGLLGCSKTETGVVAKKGDMSLTVRLIDDSDNMRLLDCFPVLNELQEMHGIYSASMLNGLHLYEKLKLGDTIVYTNNGNHNFVTIDNWNKVKKVNGMKKKDFLTYTR